MPTFFESGVFGKNTPAWHGEGRVVEGTFSLDEALKMGGLDWEVEKRPLYIKDKQNRDVVVPNAYSVTRINDDSPMGNPVGPDYQPIQNRTAFSALEIPLADRICRWETAISVRGGATIAGIVSLPDSQVEIVKGDVHYQYLTVINTHDGQGTMKIFPTDVRVVCANTVRVALNGRDKALTMNIRHTGDTLAKVREMSSIIATSRSDYAQFVKWQQQLAETEAPRSRVEGLFAELFPMSQDSDRAKTIRDNKIASLLTDIQADKLLLPQYTLTGGMSAYDIFNGVTHWVDHTVSQKKDEAGAYALVGGGNDFKSKAAVLIAQIFDVPLLKPVHAA